MLEVNALSVRYGKTQAVTDVSFRIQSGEWLMITGPNARGQIHAAGSADAKRALYRRDDA